MTKLWKMLSWKKRVELAHWPVTFVWGVAITLVHKFAKSFGGNRYRVVIFGSALLKDQTPNTNAAAIALHCLKKLYDRVHGGGGGTMKSVTEGGEPEHGANVTEEAVHVERGRRSYTLAIATTLPDIEAESQKTDLYLWAKDFALRLLHFSIWGTCFVAVVGGFGTLLEIVWMLQMIQKHRLAKKAGKLSVFGFLLHPVVRKGFEPWIIVLNDDGFYDHLQALIQRMHERGTLNEGDVDIVKFATTLQEAKDLIDENYQRYVDFCEEHGIHMENGFGRLAK